MMYDNKFLLKLDQSKNKTIYAKIIALNLQEHPIEAIEGRVTQGFINLDGASAVRRTCSLTITAQDFNYSNYLWGLNTKFSLEIGVLNEIDNKYPEIIWFKQGIYFISSFNASRSTNNFSITIQGKDKMSMLNGDMGGTINSSVDFGTIEEEDQHGNWIIRKIPIRDIIRNIVHQYAGEPLHNIVINDLPDYGLELLEYRYDVPMYLYRKENSSTYANATLDGTIKCTVQRGGEAVKTSFAELLPTELDLLVDPLMGSVSPSPVIIDDENYIIAKVEYGQTAGYRKTELTYAGDLIANVGETVTSVLDKIKNMLGEFEYFYDLDGRFVFQQKQSFVNTIYGSVSNDGENKKEQYIRSYVDASITKYNFADGELITQFNNTPNIANVRNDYSIWGQRTTMSGAQVPVHLRYAIDYKPLQYKSIFVDNNENSADKKAIDAYNNKYGTRLKGQNSVTYISADTFNNTDSDVVYCDWREIIYQMALDYYKYNHLDDFELKVANANPEHYPFGITGYEQYYIDIQGFWRQLYNPELQNKIDKLKANLNDRTDGPKGPLVQAVEDAQDIVNNKANLSASEAQIADLNLEKAQTNLTEAQQQLDALVIEIANYYYDDNEHLYWNKNVFEYPETLNFWFDFLDVEGELKQFNTKVIGCRPKAINDTNIKSIYFRETPNIFFTDTLTEREENGYKYIYTPGLLKMFSISSQGKSAKTKLDELIYQHGYCSESATISCIPIYYLQPNILINIKDKDTYLDGNYLISKISIPLTYNGTMSLTATRVAEAYFQ